MKKLFLIPILALGLSLTAQTGFKAGLHLGFPVGNASDYSGFNIGLDASYLWDVAPKFKAGVSTGYSHFTGKNQKYNTIFGTYKVKIKDFGFIPIAVTGEYKFAPKIFGALDLGYAIATSGNWDGGFYWQPKVGYDADQYQVFGYYKGISSSSNISSLGIGAAYKF